MGKAFSDEERKKIKEKIKDESFKLFKINGIRKTSISEITKNVGISQGGFYLFYKNKEEVFYDIVNSDMDIQIKHCLNYIDESISNPKKMLYTAVNHYCRHMHENRAVWLDEPDIMEILNKRKNEDTIKEKEKIRQMLNVLKNYWTKNKSIKFIDVEKLLSLFLIARTMYINKECCDDKDFEEIFDIFIKNGIDKYLF